MFDPYNPSDSHSPMIKRIVCMDLLPETEDIFLDLFSNVNHEIRSQKGCMGLELLRGSHEGQLSLWTISLWQSVDDLETYRTSALFQKTWARVKPLFSSKARAWTLSSIDTLA
ncbi:MAG: antibiotic biosynthesis monooxygenase family protein [Saprospiraceae bacterium]